MIRDDVRLALAPVPDRETDLLRAAAVAAGLVPLDLPLRWWQQPEAYDDGVTAWRVPTGAAALSAWQGWPLPLAVAPPSWLTRRPPELLGGRRLAVVTAGDVLAGRVPFDVRSVKPAVLKVRGLPAQGVAGTAAAQVALHAAQLPPGSALLVADAWLDCASEYRTFCVGREVVAASPYRIEDEGWSAELVLHRASWHEQAAQFAAEVLAGLPDADVPPACGLDVARLVDGRFAVLETNTTWAAGLYGCDPDAVLRAVLAAQRPAHPRWQFDPGAPVLRAHEHADVAEDPLSAARRRVHGARHELALGGRPRDLSIGSRDGRLLVEHPGRQDPGFEERVRRLAAPVEVGFVDSASASPCDDHDATPQHLADWVGLTEDQAEQRAVTGRLAVRLTCLDGGRVPGKLDHLPGRVLLHIADGIVVAATPESCSREGAVVPRTVGDACVCSDSGSLWLAQEAGGVDG